MNLVGKGKYSKYEIRIFMDKDYRYVFRIYNEKGKKVNNIDYIARYIPGDGTEIKILYEVVKSDIDNKINIKL